MSNSCGRQDIRQTLDTQSRVGSDPTLGVLPGRGGLKSVTTAGGGTVGEGLLGEACRRR